ncbi:MAG: hypothetical protein MK135_10000, partial [Polyangiaceae bacterium]|nr:hypothetical protein [Polyangiaceae bacterium]
MKLRTATFVLILLGSLSVACSDDKNSESTDRTAESPPEGVESETRVIETKRVVVSAKDGGTIEITSAGLEIPAGALPADIEVTVSDVTDEELSELPETSGGEESIAVPVKFEPHGLQFDVPVTITLNFEPPAGATAQLVVMKLDDEQDTTWEVVPGATFQDGVASFETTSFSFYGVFEAPEEPMSSGMGGAAPTSSGGTSGDPGVGGGDTGSGATSSSGGDPGVGGGDSGSGDDTGSGATSSSGGDPGVGGGDSGSGGDVSSGGSPMGGAGPDDDSGDDSGS